MKPFRDINAQEITSSYLHQEFEARGYVLLRNLMPSKNIQDLLGDILKIISNVGWLASEHDFWNRIVEQEAACGESDPQFEVVYNNIFHLESLHSFAHYPELQQVMRMIVGERLLVHPKPICRLIFPNSGRYVIDAHQDHLAIGGDARCYTAWMPLHDCPTELGPLEVLEGSHKFGLQKADSTTGMIPREHAKGEDWVGGRINAGDVLIFHGLTVHSALPNTSRQLRISIDCRFQDYADLFNPANMVFPSATDRSWDAIYASWQPSALKYFWQRLPLRFKPSVEELENLAQTSESPRMRLRYARILSQVRSQVGRYSVGAQTIGE